MTRTCRPIVELVEGVFLGHPSFFLGPEATTTAKSHTKKKKWSKIQLFLHHIITSSHQHIITSTHQHIITSSHQHINTSSHQHINTSTHQHINTSTHQHINTSSHHHISTPSAILCLVLALIMGLSVIPVILVVLVVFIIIILDDAMPLALWRARDNDLNRGRTSTLLLRRKTATKSLGRGRRSSFRIVSVGRNEISQTFIGVLLHQALELFQKMGQSLKAARESSRERGQERSRGRDVIVLFGAKSLIERVFCGEDGDLTKGTTFN